MIAETNFYLLDFFKTILDRENIVCIRSQGGSCERTICEVGLNDMFIFPKIFFSIEIRFCTVA